MGIVKTMYKPINENPLLPHLEAAAKREAERVIAKYDRKIKESLNNPNKKAGLEPAH